MWKQVSRRSLFLGRQTGALKRWTPPATSQVELIEFTLGFRIEEKCNKKGLATSSLPSIRTTGKYEFNWDEPFEKDGEDTRDDHNQKNAEGGTGSNSGETEETEDIKQGTSPVGGKLSRQLIRLSPEDPVTPVLQQWLSDGNPLPKNIVIIALTNLKRHRRYKQALEVSNYVWKENLYEMDDVDHMYRLYFTGQTGSIEEVEKAFEETPSKWCTELLYNQLMSCYIARGMISQAEKALEKLRNSGIPVSALPFTQFLSLYSRQRQFDKALKLIAEMTAANIVPDTRTYNILMSLTQKQGDHDKLLRFYKTMKDSGVTPDSFSYSLAIKAYMVTGKEEEAESLVDEMSKHNPEDRELANDLLLAVYGDLGKEKELKKLWSKVQSSNNLSARSYGVMIESLGKLGLVEEAESLAKKAERKKGRLVARIFNAMMDVYARHGKMEAAEELLAQIQRDRLRPNTVTYSHLIAGYLKVGQLEKALEYLQISREGLSYDHSKPWLDSFLLVLENLAERREVDRAEHTFQAFTSSGPYRCTLVYNALLKAYVKARKPAPNFLERMSQDGFQPDEDTIELLSQLESCMESSIG